jgi:predicted lipoprotein with Yx(FWY)xxD motif
MKITTPIALGGALLVAAALAAGCGGTSYGGGGSGTSSSKSPASKTPTGYGYGHSSGSGSATTSTSSGPATVAVKGTSLGQVLVDGRGMTLYLFEKDTGTTSMCDGSCAQFWPPLTTKGAAKAGTGVAAGKLGTTTRSDGSMQVTYNGHPVYFYAGDQKPGDVNGQGQNAFGALWYVLSPAGNAVTG